MQRASFHRSTLVEDLYASSRKSAAKVVLKTMRLAGMRSASVGGSGSLIGQSPRMMSSSSAGKIVEFLVPA